MTTQEPTLSSTISTNLRPMDTFGDTDCALEKATGSWITLESICSDQSHSFSFPGRSGFLSYHQTGPRTRNYVKPQRNVCIFSDSSSRYTPGSQKSSPEKTVRRGKETLCVAVLQPKKHLLPNHPLWRVAFASTSHQFSRLTLARFCASGYPASWPRR